MKKVINSVKEWSGLPIFIIVLLLIFLNSRLTKNFLSAGVLEGFLSTYAPLILVALAQTIVIMSGGIDLSVGGVVSLSNVMTIVLVGAGWDFMKVGPAGGLYICNTPGACQNGWPFLLAALGGIAAGMLIGLINAIAVGVFRIRPLLATLATQFIAYGLALYLLPLPGGRIPIDIVTWYQGTIVGIPVAGWVIIVMALVWVLFMRLPFGTNLKATGNNIQKAYNSGIPIQGTLFTTYLLSSVIASIAGIALTMSIAAGDSTVGIAFTLNSVAAAVLGGISLSGGEGEVGGPIFGAIFLGLIVNTILGARVPSWYQWLTSGIIIVLGLFGSVTLKRIMKKKEKSRIAE